MGKFITLLCGVLYLIYVVIFSLNYWFDIGSPLDLEEVFISIMCLGGYLANKDEYI